MQFINVKKTSLSWFDRRVAAVCFLCHSMVDRCGQSKCVIGYVVSGCYGYSCFVTAVVEEILQLILFGRRVAILVSELGGEWMGVVEDF